MPISGKGVPRTSVQTHISGGICTVPIIADVITGMTERVAAWHQTTYRSDRARTQNYNNSNTVRPVGATEAHSHSGVDKGRGRHGAQSPLISIFVKTY